MGSTDNHRPEDTPPNPPDVDTPNVVDPLSCEMPEGEPPFHLHPPYCSP